MAKRTNEPAGWSGRPEHPCRPARRSNAGWAPPGASTPAVRAAAGCRVASPPSRGVTAEDWRHSRAICNLHPFATSLLTPARVVNCQPENPMPACRNPNSPPDTPRPSASRTPATRFDRRSNTSSTTATESLPLRDTKAHPCATFPAPPACRWRTLLLLRVQRASAFSDSEAHLHHHSRETQARLADISDPEQRIRVFIHNHWTIS